MKWISATLSPEDRSKNHEISLVRIGLDKAFRQLWTPQTPEADRTTIQVPGGCVFDVLKEKEQYQQPARPSLAVLDHASWSIDGTGKFKTSNSREKRLDTRGTWETKHKCTVNYTRSCKIVYLSHSYQKPNNRVDFEFIHLHLCSPSPSPLPIPKFPSSFSRRVICYNSFLGLVCKMQKSKNCRKWQRRKI